MTNSCPYPLGDFATPKLFQFLARRKGHDLQSRAGGNYGLMAGIAAMIAVSVMACQYALFREQAGPITFGPMISNCMADKGYRVIEKRS